MNKLVCNQFSTFLPTMRISDILKTEDCMTKLRCGDLNSFNSLKELVIKKDLFRNSQCHLVINNFPNLETIIIKQNDLYDIESLTICDNDQLKKIVIEGSKQWGDGVFWKVKNVRIESI